MVVPTIMRVSPHTRTVSGSGSEPPGGSQVNPDRLTMKEMTRALSTPTMAPTMPRRNPSMTNKRRIPLCRRPTERKVPISVVRSTTAAFIVLLTVNSTMPPISTKMKPKIVSKRSRVWV